MDERRGSTDHRLEATRYEIRLKGHLDSRWADWLGGMSLTHAGDGTTVVAGPVVDQAALHGLLQKLRDMGVTLVSVNETTADVPSDNAARANKATDTHSTRERRTR
jgi:hypothetical protein